MVAGRKLSSVSLRRHKRFWFFLKGPRSPVNWTFLRLLVTFLGCFQASHIALGRYSSILVSIRSAHCDGAFAQLVIGRYVSHPNVSCCFAFPTLRFAP